MGIFDCSSSKASAPLAFASTERRVSRGKSRLPPPPGSAFSSLETYCHRGIVVVICAQSSTDLGSYQEDGSWARKISLRLGLPQTPFLSRTGRCQNIGVTRGHSKAPTLNICGSDVGIIIANLEELPKEEQKFLEVIHIDSLVPSRIIGES